MSESFNELASKKRALLSMLNDVQKDLAQAQGEAGNFDIHHPERSPGWKPYRHQDFPKMMYHPIKLDSAVEAQRDGVRRRNRQNPSAPQMDLPQSQPLTRRVENAEEFEQAEREGFVTGPKALSRILELHNQDSPEYQTNDPLSDPELVGAGKKKR